MGHNTGLHEALFAASRSGEELPEALLRHLSFYIENGDVGFTNTSVYSIGILAPLKHYKSELKDLLSKLTAEEIKALLQKANKEYEDIRIKIEQDKLLNTGYASFWKATFFLQTGLGFALACNAPERDWSKEITVEVCNFEGKKINLEFTVGYIARYSTFKELEARVPKQFKQFINLSEDEKKLFKKKESVENTRSDKSTDSKWKLYAIRFLACASILYLACRGISCTNLSDIVFKYCNRNLDTGKSPGSAGHQMP